MREQHGPRIADPVMETDLAFRRLRLEIRRSVVDCKSHHILSSRSTVILIG
jgi:hypothetical protein